MMEHVNALAASVVALAWDHFVQVAVLAVVLALIDATLGRRLGPTWRCALWLIFLLKLALPPQISSPTSPVYWLTGHREQPMARMAAGDPEPSRMGAESAGEWRRNEVVPTAAEAARAVECSTSGGPTWQALLTGGWAVGAGLFAFGSLAQVLRLRRVLRDSEPGGSSLRDAVARAAARVKVSGAVEVRVVSADIAPLVTGLLRPVIHFPRGLVARLSPEQLHAVLVHELWHVRRGDLWVAAAQGLARVLFFYHPAVWWVNARLSQLREEATDQAVLTHPEVSPRSYSLALVEAAALLTVGAEPSRFALGVIETKSQLKKRITMNLHPTRTRRPRLGLPGLLSLSAFALLLLPMAPAQAENNPAVLAPGFRPADPAPLIQRIDTTTTAIMNAFNRHDRDAYLAFFTPDAVMLPEGSDLITGSAGIAQAYLRVPAKMVYEPIQWGPRQIHAVDRWLIETGVMNFQLRLAPEAAVMGDPRQALTIWEQLPDGSLKVKLLSWNKLAQAGVIAQPGAPVAFAGTSEAAKMSATGDFSAVLKAEEDFHRLFEQERGAEAAAYYSEGATLIPPQVLPLRGRAAIAHHLAAAQDGAKLKRLERQVALVEGNAERVLVVNLFRWTFQPAGAEAPIAIAGKGVHVWQRESDGTWRILFDLPNASQRTE